jgi:glycosyltransferase involved in cell wall biosynthesis
MKNRTVTARFTAWASQYQNLFVPENIKQNIIIPGMNMQNIVQEHSNHLAEILFITSYPPRECGIATYSQDLIKALNNKFSNSLSIKVCALESGKTNYDYPSEVKYVLKTSVVAEYEKLAVKINNDNKIKIVFIQHEFGFYRLQEQAFLNFLYTLTKPVAIVFHTVLPHPDEQLKAKIKSITEVAESVVVMTHTSSDILTKEYGVPVEKINVIAHGTHLVTHLSEKFLKKKYKLTGRKVLTTFGLLSSGKSIETTLEALPAIVKTHPEIMFLVIGKTHPEVVKEEGEKYREILKQKVIDYALQDNVRFVNSYLPLPDLLEYLQLTDIYVFTTNDPNQAVSGTFAYAMSCACPIISTPIPHAKEVLSKDTGIIFDFRNSTQLAAGVLNLLNDEPLRRSMSLRTLEKIMSTTWENSAVAHAMLFKRLTGGKITIKYNNPDIKLDHMLAMTTDVGIIQFSKVNQPDIKSGYTVDDNARALVAVCMDFKLTHNKKLIFEIHKYLNFIKLCQQSKGNFLNYVDQDLKFTDKNKVVNLDDPNGRAIWSLGYLTSLAGILPVELIEEAESIINKSLRHITAIHSPRSMAFIIKGLSYYQVAKKQVKILKIITSHADRLVKLYRHEASPNWEWFEGYLTYANSILPEALLCAWKLTGNNEYKSIAVTSFDFLLSQTFNENGIEVISNKSWLHKGMTAEKFGEQPIDVAYSVMALSKFYDELKNEDYYLKMNIAFNWFLGHNRLQQIIYNPCTGGCYDGLEETHANLNQGAESTVSYLMARLTVEKYKKTVHSHKG